MSVRAVFDLSKGSFLCHSEPESVDITVEVGFAGGGDFVQFSGLSFGWEAYVDGVFAQSIRRPRDGEKILSTDQPFVSSDLLNAPADSTVTIKFWASDADLSLSGEHAFVVPRPPSPHPSWVWAGDHYVPPVPYPRDAGLYVWDEATAGWVPYLHS